MLHLPLWPFRTINGFVHDGQFAAIVEMQSKLTGLENAAMVLALSTLQVCLVGEE